MAQPQQSYLRVHNDPECTRIEFTEKHVIDEAEWAEAMGVR